MASSNPILHNKLNKIQNLDISGKQEISAVDFNKHCNIDIPRKKDQYLVDDEPVYNNEFSEISSIVSGSSQAILDTDEDFKTAPNSNLSKLSNRKSSMLYDINLMNNVTKSSISNNQQTRMKNKSMAEMVENKNNNSRLSLGDLKKSRLFDDYFGDSTNRLSINFNSKIPTNKFNDTIADLPNEISAPENKLKTQSIMNFNEKKIYEVYKRNAELTKNQEVKIEFAKFLFEQIKALQLEQSIYKNITSDNGESCNSHIVDLRQDAINIILDLSRNKNNPEANYILGTWYEYGLLGFKQNLNKAHQLYNTCAKAGYAPGIDKMGYFIELKNRNFNKAFKFYKKAAALGDPSSNYRIGIAILHKEIKISQNNHINSALFYLRRSANLANNHFPQGAYVMALILLNLYEVNLNVQTDYREAEFLMTKAADFNYVKAQLKLGYIYEHGLYGFGVNPAKSIYYYRLAAYINNNPQAMLSLSGWYLTGAPKNIIVSDDSRAFELCEMALRTNNEKTGELYYKTQYAMGYYYEVGVHVEADGEKALEWYRLSASNGCEEASKKIHELTQQNSKNMKPNRYKSEDIHRKNIFQQNQSYKSSDTNQKNRSKPKAGSDCNIF